MRIDCGLGSEEERMLRAEDTAMAKALRWERGNVPAIFGVSNKEARLAGAE